MYFKTTENLKNADVSLLKTVAGVSEETAKALFDVIHEYD